MCHTKGLGIPLAIGTAGSSGLRGGQVESTASPHLLLSHEDMIAAAPAGGLARQKGVSHPHRQKRGWCFWFTSKWLIPLLCGEETQGIFRDGSGLICFRVGWLFLRSSAAWSIHIALSTDYHVSAFSCWSFLLSLHFLPFLLHFSDEKYPLQRVCSLAVCRGPIKSVSASASVEGHGWTSSRFLWGEKFPPFYSDVAEEHLLEKYFIFN